MAKSRTTRLRKLARLQVDAHVVMLRSLHRQRDELVRQIADLRRGLTQKMDVGVIDRRSVHLSSELRAVGEAEIERIQGKIARIDKRILTKKQELKEARVQEQSFSRLEKREGIDQRKLDQLQIRREDS